MKRIKQILPIIIAFIIGISTTVGAVTVFNSKDVTYSSSATSKKNVKEALDELYTKANTPWTCASGWYCYKQACPDGNLCRDSLVKNVQLGDYISMTPTSTSYTISKDLTGYTSDQTINPSELKLWRVIRKNNDGTVDAVSEYTSNRAISFTGRKGYQNYIHTLNMIAAQYTNTKYVSNTRYMGYDNQIETCSELSLESCPSDEGYKTDETLVSQTLGTLIAAPPGVTTWQAAYWVASRFADKDSSSSEIHYRVRAYSSKGIEFKKQLITSWDYTGTADLYYLRPIITFKANVQIKSGDGKSANTAYKFE